MLGFSVYEWEMILNWFKDLTKDLVLFSGASQSMVITAELLSQYVDWLQSCKHWAYSGPQDEKGGKDSVEVFHAG